MASSPSHIDPVSFDNLADDWDRILASCANGINGPDATCSLVWARTLGTTLLAESEVHTLTISNGNRVVGILPTYGTSKSDSPIRLRERRLITEAYSGRTGLLVDNNDPSLVQRLLEASRCRAPPWDLMLLHVVADSPSHVAVAKAVRELSLNILDLGSNKSPYIELGTSWNELLGSLPKKMRWTIRKSEKDLAAKGELAFEEIRSPADAGTFLDSVYQIERKSWKEASGTSITAQNKQQSFYESLVRLAGQRGMLNAYLLRLNGEPIAYILGILSSDRVFLDLKESFNSDYSEHSPGHVLKRFAIESLIARGALLYDFMGNCEPYKMKWTDKTYTTVSLAIYNSTIRGRLAYVRTRIRQKASSQQRERQEDPSRS
jgi:CelD/BcsL family acetyltransferase involved in cellulose biosynthesis